MREMQDWLREQDRGAFGAAEVHSRRVMQQLSFAAQRAADNLLAKALRALDDQDANRAREFAERAARLPFDEHEHTAPAAWAAQMQLFTLVSDAAEAAGPADSRWLDAAIEVLSDSDDRAACDVRDTLEAIDHDYSLTRDEHRRIRSAIASVPQRAELRDLDVSPSELADHLLSILEACRAYQAAMQKLAG